MGKIALQLDGVMVERKMLWNVWVSLMLSYQK